MDPVLEYIYNLHGKRKRILFLKTHEFISGLIPGLKAKIKYSVPFYSYFSDLCYVNPYKEHLYVGFLEGALLMDRTCLDKSDTKSIAKYYVRNESDIFSDQLNEIIIEAAILNEKSS